MQQVKQMETIIPSCNVKVIYVDKSTHRPTDTGKHEIKCSKCHQWKTPENYAPSFIKNNYRFCRSCQTAKRKKKRQDIIKNGLTNAKRIYGNIRRSESRINNELGKKNKKLCFKLKDLENILDDHFKTYEPETDTPKNKIHKRTNVTLIRKDFGNYIGWDNYCIILVKEAFNYEQQHLKTFKATGNKIQGIKKSNKMKKLNKR